MDHWLFVHVMKTAGTSFRLMLEEQLAQEIYPTREELAAQRGRWYLRAPELLARVADGRLDLGRRRFVCGHYPVNLRDLLPGSWRTVIFLREPVARTLSMIGHRQRNAGFFRRRIAPEGIADWLKKDTFVRGVVENYQTKVLSIGGSENVNKPVKSDKEMLEQAFETIDSVDFVGLTEYFNDSISVFNDISGMNFSTIPHANRAKGRSAVSDQDIEAIRRLVPYDLELYERAREKLMARIGTRAAERPAH
jgi:hypothetical protein